MFSPICIALQGDWNVWHFSLLKFGSFPSLQSIRSFAISFNSLHFYIFCQAANVECALQWLFDQMPLVSILWKNKQCIIKMVLSLFIYLFLLIMIIIVIVILNVRLIDVAWAIPRLRRSNAFLVSLWAHLVFINGSDVELSVAVSRP